MAAKPAEKPAAAEAKPAGRGECFVIMPISDPEGYPAGHFERVYKDLFSPAIEKAGFVPKRADDVLETNIIHLDLLRRLLDAPMAVCDLSSRNPNVLFELGLRQAFDKPVVLVAEEGTPRIFDVDLLRATNYRKARIYHEVLEDQQRITDAINATRVATDENRGANSLIRLLGITQPASLAEIKEAERDPALQVVLGELTEMRREIHRIGRVQTDTAVSRPLGRVFKKVGDDSERRTTRRISFIIKGDREAVERFQVALNRLSGISVDIEIFRTSSTESSGFLTFDAELTTDLVGYLVRIAAVEAEIPPPEFVTVA